MKPRSAKAKKKPTAAPRARRSGAPHDLEAERAAAPEAERLRAESEVIEREQIRSLLRRPMIERTHFLRLKLPLGLRSTL